MTDEKLTEQNHNSFFSKRLSMPVQRQHDFEENEISNSFFPSSIQKQCKIGSPSSQIMNINNPLTAFNCMSMIRPTSFDTSQSLRTNHSDPMNAATLNQRIDSNPLPYSTAYHANSLEEPAVLKINIPIEMIVRTIPQQLSQSSQQLSLPLEEQRTNRCNHPTHSCPASQTSHQTSSDWSSKPATSLIRKAQEVFFGTTINNDRDVVPNSIRRADLLPSDPRITNEPNKSVFVQQQQQTKNLHKPFQGTQHQSIMSQCIDSSPFSHPRRCECGSILYSSL